MSRVCPSTAVFKLVDEIKAIKAAGYYNPVPTGDHSLNMYRTGNENGAHTIVAISGCSDGSMSITWRPLTSAFESDNEIIFIDRAGYGLSDDTDDDMTVDYVVEDYRAALMNAGVEGPYILMAHSYGGIYTAYWQSTYPDEVEGVIMMDGVLGVSDEERARLEAEQSNLEKLMLRAVVRLPWLFAHTGLFRLYPLADYSNVTGDFTSEEMEYSMALMCRTAGTRACYSETLTRASYDQVNRTWNHIFTNDIPKIYIDASEDYEGAVAFAQRLGNTTVYNLPGDHVIYLDRTEECIDIIEEFLKGLD